MEKNHSYIIADHIRSSCVIIADGVMPSGKQRGYVLRRLIRRALSSSVALGIDISDRAYFEELVESVVNIYDGVYDEIKDQKELIVDALYAEAGKYQRAMRVGEREWQKYLAKEDANTDGKELANVAWNLYQTHGVPFEISESEVENSGNSIDAEYLESLIEEHQKKSQTVMAGKFKSGLGEQNEETMKLHTTTHIVHSVLRDMFGDSVHQVGSAITTEKARFDVSLEKKLTEDELEVLKTGVQKIIDLNCDMVPEEMSKEEAAKLGAVGLFGEKYGDVVTIYTLTGSDGVVYSQEYCGGPHVKNTSEIGQFELIKQKSIGAGKKRLEYKVS